jgi:hypothetical protein
MKKCSTPLAMMEMQIKTILRFHLTPVRLAITEKTNNTNADEDEGKKGTLIHCW